MSDELTSGLRELAAAGETSPSLTGAEIRGRAGRRRRRRRTALAGAGACAAGALALVVALGPGGGTDHGTPPAASPTGAPSGPVTPNATVDLSRRVLAASGRTMPLTAGTAKAPTPTGRMTVTAKQTVRRMIAEEVGLGEKYDVKVPWVIELTGSDGAKNFVAALTYDPKAPGNYDRTNGWIGLRPHDAQWLYEHLDVGAVVDVEAAAGSTASSPTSTNRAEGGATRGPGGPGTAAAGTGTGSASGASGH
ncbi:L,D-transpeptidase [Streptomyces sp. NPDC060187]|uniref:L,D-transpeptidase n=1 Tax=Streptomyces sp. NPDC060187 TaxID=3347067 RepID=UPI003665CC8D